MEDGISQANMGGKLEETVTRADGKIRYTLNKTYNEIINLINNGIAPFVLKKVNDGYNIYWVSGYSLLTIDTTYETYSTDSSDGYPYY